MNGAEILVKTAVNAGIELCFANAGTTELPIATAFDRISGIKAVLGLFEGVCTGAADGYGRMLARPAMTLLHLGPGFANGIANLHNARRAGSPILSIIGDHATWHQKADAPLNMDILSLVRTVSGWHKKNRSVQTISRNIMEATNASLYGQIASLIVPNDHQLEEWKGPPFKKQQFSFDPVDGKTIEKAASLLRKYRKTALILSGRALREQGLRAVAHIQRITGCDLFTQSFPPYMERGVGLPEIERISYFPEPAIKRLSPYEAFILAGTNIPVTFFGYKGIESYLINKEQKTLQLTTAKQNVAEALEYLAQALGSSPRKSKIKSPLQSIQRPDYPQGRLTPEKACAIIAALQPENAIIVDEGLTSALTYYPLTDRLPRHSYMTIAGGSIGYGMPCAVGASLACPDRPVINIQADGSGLYTLQALWTEAREGLNVTTLICANRSYNILFMELERAGIKEPGQKTRSLADLGNPHVDWVSIARGFGVPGIAVDTAEGLRHELNKALSEPGPHLIEMVFV